MSPQYPCRCPSLAFFLVIALCVPLASPLQAFHAAVPLSTAASPLSVAALFSNLTLVPNWSSLPCKVTYLSNSTPNLAGQCEDLTKWEVKNPFSRLGVKGDAFVWYAASSLLVAQTSVSVSWSPVPPPPGSDPGPLLVPIKTSGSITLVNETVSMSMDVEVRRIKGVKRLGDWILRRQLRRMMRYASSEGLETKEGEGEVILERW